MSDFRWNKTIDFFLLFYIPVGRRVWHTAAPAGKKKSLQSCTHTTNTTLTNNQINDFQHDLKHRKNSFSWCLLTLMYPATICNSTKYNLYFWFYSTNNPRVRNAQCIMLMERLLNVRNDIRWKFQQWAVSRLKGLELIPVLNLHFVAL